MCALSVSGDMNCWGNNIYHPVGQGEPRKGPFTQIAADREASCGLRANGQVSCCGYRRDIDEPGRWDSPPGRFVQFDVDWGLTCGVRDDTTLACWGYRQDEHGTAIWPFDRVHTIDDRVERLPDGAGYTAIRIWRDEACASRTDGTIECWGLSDAPVRVPLVGDLDLEHLWGAGGSYCALDKADGTLHCNDEEWRARYPEYLQSKFLSLSFSRVCQLLINGSVACGSADDGPPTGSGPFRDATASGDTVCAINNRRQTVCWEQRWNSDVFEQVEPDSLAYRQDQEHALPTTGLLRFADRSTGCAIDTAGELRGFCAYEPRDIYDIYGYHPDEDLLEEPPAGLFAKAALSGSHACGIRLDGTLDCWGYPYDVYTLDKEPCVVDE